MIAGLDPSGGETVYEKSAYAVIEDTNYAEDPDILEESELDRQFQIHGIIPASMSIEGMTTTNVCNGSFQIAIGHILGDYRDSRDRRDKDLQQIVAQVIHLDNKPSGVHSIRHLDTSTRLIREGTYFWTVMEFAITYSAAADYGGS